MVLGSKMRLVLTVFCLICVEANAQNKNLYYVPEKFKLALDNGDTIAELLQPVQLISKKRDYYWIEGFDSDEFNIEIKKVLVKCIDSTIYQIRRPVFSANYRFKEFGSDTLGIKLIYKLKIYPKYPNKIVFSIEDPLDKRILTVNFSKVNGWPVSYYTNGKLHWELRKIKP